MLQTPPNASTNNSTLQHSAQRKAAAAAAAKTPNLASRNAAAVGIAAPVELDVDEAPFAMTDLMMLNWSATCCSLNALAPDGSAVYQFGRE